MVKLWTIHGQCSMCLDPELILSRIIGIIDNLYYIKQKDVLTARFLFKYKIYLFFPTLKQ